MLNNSTSAAQSLNIANVLLSAKWQKVTDAGYGHIFTLDNFASEWNSIYVNPSDLKLDGVSKGMRKLVAPTLLISSENSMMAYVLATEDAPVYIQNEYTKDKYFGYIMAFAISPEISPEYMFYTCEYNLWSQLLKNRIGVDDYCPSWDNIGIVGYDPEYGDIEITPEDIVRNLGEISIHSIDQQKALVSAAYEQEAIVEHQRYEVADLVNRYMMFAREGSIFSQNGLGLLVEVYSIAAGDNANQEVLATLESYKFKADILSKEELCFLSKHLNEVFALVISSNGTTFHPSEGFVQPQEVTDFMCKIASFPTDVIVYNPFAGADSYAIALPNKVVGEELNPTTWALGQIRLFANHADKRADIALGNSFDSMKSNEKFSAIITSPVYLIEEGHEISDIVRMLYNKLEDGGKLACIVSAGFLFRNEAKVRSVRETLIKEKAIASVVMFPSNIFAGTSVVQAAILLTKGIENEEIYFGDATGHTRFAKSVYRATTFDLESFMEAFEADIEDTQEGNEPCEVQTGVVVTYDKLIGSDLTPALYLTPKPANGIPLSDLVEEVPELRGKEITAEYFLTGSSIPAAMHRKPFVPIKVEDGKVSTAKKYVQVPQTAVILAIVSGNIRTVYTEGFTGKIASPAGFIKVFKPVEGISAKYLAAVMSTKIVADQIKAQTVGVIIPRLNKIDLSRIIVPVHETAEEREQLVAEVLSSEMSDLESELQETLESQKREVRSTRHAMAQTLLSLSSKWERLKRFARAHNGTIHFSDTIGRVNPTTVEEFMDGMEYAIVTLRRQVDSFRLEKRDWGEPEEINPYEFIETYRANHPSTDFVMQNLGNDNKADIPYFTNDDDEEHMAHTDALFTFKAPRALVERIFDNIVSNAKAHGFTQDIANPIIQFDWQDNAGKIEITVKNNGVPLKDGVSGADVLMSDFSTALKQKASDGSLHFGIGGFEIKSLMEGLGSVEVISQPKAEFPVIYKLIFNNVNFAEVNLFDE